MRFKTLKVATLICAASFLTSSCVGSFTLFNKLAAWNKDATGNMFLNEIIFLVISPAYGVCATVDALVLNTIEFWTDENPLASNAGKVQSVMGSDGKMYAVKNMKNGYEVTKDNGEVVVFRFDKKTKTWSEIANGKETKLVSINEDGTVNAYFQNGVEKCLTMDSNGVQEAQRAVMGDMAFGR